MSWNSAISDGGTCSLLSASGQVEPARRFGAVEFRATVRRGTSVGRAIDDAIRVTDRASADRKARPTNPILFPSTTVISPAPEIVWMPSG